MINRIVKTLACAGASLALLAGCASGGPLLKPVTEQVPVVGQSNQVNVTNVVSQVQTVTVTNGVTQTNQVTVTNQAFVTNVVPVTNLVTITNAYQVNPSVSNVIGTAQMINGATAPLDPYSGLINGVLAGGLAILGWYARLKTKEAQQHLSTASTIITAVENLAPTVGDGVKAAIAQQSLKMGTQATVAATVSAVTADLAKTS